MFCVAAPGTSVYINKNLYLVTSLGLDTIIVSFVTPLYARVMVRAVSVVLISPVAQTNTLWVAVVVSDTVVPVVVSLVAGICQPAAVPLEALKYCPTEGAVAADTSRNVVAVFRKFAATLLLAAVIVLLVNVWAAPMVIIFGDSLASGIVPDVSWVAFRTVIFEPLPKKFAADIFPVTSTRPSIVT